MARVTVLLFSLVFVGVGAFFVVNAGRKAHRGYGQYRRAKAMGETETSEVQAVGPGTVELRGTAKPIDDAGTLSPPFGDGDALATYVAVADYGGGGDGPTWITIHEEGHAKPFLLDDGTGEIPVSPPADATGVTFDIDATRVGVDESPPENIRRYIESEAAIEEAQETSIGPIEAGTPRRYSEGVIAPGDDVYVLGQAVESDRTWGDTRFEVTSGEDSEFVLSDLPEEELQSSGNRQALADVIFAGVTAFLGGLAVVAGLFIAYLSI